MRVLVVVGSIDGALLNSDRAAVCLAASQFAGNVNVHSPMNDESSIRYALAAGASRVVPLNSEDADLVVFGQGGTAPIGDALPAQLALEQNSTLVFDVLEYDRYQQGLVVTRDLGRGEREILTIEIPVVLVMSEQAKSPSYISRFRQLAVADQARAGCLALSNSPATELIRWETTLPRTRAGGLEKKTAGNAMSRMFTTFGLSEQTTTDSADQQVINGEAETCASHLLRYLAHHGFVDLRYAPDESGPLSTAGKPASTDVRQSDDSIDDSSQIASTVTCDSPSLQSESANLARRPRPVGQRSPRNLRGPFPVRSNKQ